MMIFLFVSPAFLVFPSSCRAITRGNQFPALSRDAFAYRRCYVITLRVSPLLRITLSSAEQISCWDTDAGHNRPLFLSLIYSLALTRELFAYSFPRYSSLPSAGAPFAPGGAFYANPNGHDDQKLRVIVGRSPRSAAYVDDPHVLCRRPPLSPPPPSRGSLRSDRIGREREGTENDVALSRRTC